MNQTTTPADSPATLAGEHDLLRCEVAARAAGVVRAGR